jgi:hypothetical protein
MSGSRLVPQHNASNAHPDCRDARRPTGSAFTRRYRKEHERIRFTRPQPRLFCFVQPELAIRVKKIRGISVSHEDVAKNARTSVSHRKADPRY